MNVWQEQVSNMTAFPVISVKPSYNSVVRGCPGIPETLPRVECQLQIKSNNGQKIKIERIEVLLKTIETLHSKSAISITSAPSVSSQFEAGILSNNNSDNSSNSSIRSSSNGPNSLVSGNGRSDSLISKGKKRKNKFELTTVHFKKVINLKSNEKKSLIGLDIPLTIALPDDIKETNYNEKFGNCITVLECNVQYDSNHIKNFTHSINVEKYTFLPSNQLFPPISKKIYSPDKKFIINYKIENPCVTTDDMLKISIDFRPDLKSNIIQSQNKSKLFNKKIKLKNITFQLKEILQINDTSNVSPLHSHHHVHHPYISHTIDSKENIIQSSTRDVNEVISLYPIHLDNDIRISTKDKFFRKFESTSQEPEFLYKLPEFVNESETQGNIKTLLLQNKNNNIPFQYHNSITTLGSFFSILHCLTIKFKIGNGKDFEITQNITVSRWSKIQLKYIQQMVKQETQTAQFARKFYDNFGGITRKRIDSPTTKDNNRRNSSFTDQSDKESYYYLEYPILPPVLYYFNDETLKQFNIRHVNLGKKPRQVPVIE